MKNTISKILTIMMLLLVITGYSQTGVQIIINPSPTLYSIQGGGQYCAGTPGLPISLSGSQFGVVYQLLVNGNNVGMPLNGTGTSLSFGNQLMGGTYTIVGTSITTGCSVTMSNTANIQVNPIPSVSLTANGPVEFCGSGTVTLTGNAGSNHTYQWYKNGSILTGSNLNQYVANATGMYKVVATSNSTGCSNSRDTMIQVHELPEQYLVSTNSSTFCQGGTGFSINLANSEIGVNYQLMVNNTPQGVAVAGTGTLLSWNNQTTPGTYTVIATDNLSSCTTMMTGSAIISMNPLPLAASVIAGPTSVCQNSTASFSCSNIANASSYMWSVPNGATIISGQGTTQITVAFTSNNSGNISVFGQNSCGGGQPSTLAVVVNQAPSLTVTANPSDICAGNSTTLTANGGTSFIWTGGGDGNQITINPNSTITYTVTATNTNGCTATGNVTVNVHTAPAVSLNLTEDNFCTSTNMAVISGGAPAGGTYTGGCLFNGNSVYPPVSGAGTWVVTYTYTDTYGCSAAATDLITINPIPVVNFNSITGQINTDTPPFDMMNFVMPIGGTFSGPGFVAGSSMYNPAAAGAGTHMLTYTYEHPITGCSASQIQYVTVTGTGNNTGVDEVSINSINIYPNPASDNITFTGIEKIKSLTIMTVQGSVVYSTETNAAEMTINISDFAPGTYFVRFITADGTPISSKFTKAN